MFIPPKIGWILFLVLPRVFTDQPLLMQISRLSFAPSRNNFSIGFFMLICWSCSATSLWSTYRLPSWKIQKLVDVKKEKRSENEALEWGLICITRLLFSWFAFWHKCSSRKWWSICFISYRRSSRMQFLSSRVVWSVLLYRFWISGNLLLFVLSRYSPLLD